MKLSKDLFESALEEIKGLDDFKGVTEDEAKIIEETLILVSELTLQLPTVDEAKRKQITEMDLKMAKDTLLDIGAAKGLRVGKQSLAILRRTILSTIRVGLVAAL